MRLRLVVEFDPEIRRGPRSFPSCRAVLPLGTPRRKRSPTPRKRWCYGSNHRQLISRERRFEGILQKLKASDVTAWAGASLRAEVGKHRPEPIGGLKGRHPACENVGHGHGLSGLGRTLDQLQPGPPLADSLPPSPSLWRAGQPGLSHGGPSALAEPPCTLMSSFAFGARSSVV